MMPVVNVTNVTTATPVEKDMTSHRIVELSNNQKLHVVCHDPYGHWTVHNEAGGVKNRIFEGAFTTFDEAMNAVRKYVSTKYRTEVVEVKNKAS